MLLAELRVSVVMQRSQAEDPRSGGGSWRALAVTATASDVEPLPRVPTPRWRERIEYVEPGLVVPLHHDTCDEARANWASSQPQVFVFWALRDDVARVVRVAVSRGEAGAMSDAADGADAVPMPPFVHSWLGVSLAVHHPAEAPPRELLVQSGA